MNQFDELFGKKLNEEQPFGGQKRSWTQLSHDLNTFEAGASVAAKSLALWKAVSVVALLSAVALLWERQHLVRENEQLKNMQQQALPNTPLAKQDVASIPEQTTTKPAFNTQTSSAQSIQQDFKPEPSSTTLPSVLQGRKTLSGKARSSSAALPDAAPGKIAEVALPHPVEAGNENQHTSAALDEKADAPVTGADKILIVNDLNNTSDGNNVADSSAIAVQNSPVNADSLLQKSPEKLDSALQAPVAAAPPVIDPVRNRPSRLRAGIRLSLGYHLPQEKGLSVVKGQGVGLAFRVWNNFSVTAAADFMQYDVNTDSIPKHYCSLKLPPPGPGHHFFDLENVSSNQIMQQYTLGLRYSFKLIGPLRLSANAAHTWVHHPSRLASLRFEEMPHGGGPNWHPDDEYLNIQSLKSWSDNIWRLGLGLQYETPRWAFGINGDYSKKLHNSKPSFDTAYASAEIMYKF